MGPVARRLLAAFRRRSFPGSQEHWERRYVSGGTSGAGSYGKLAEFKAEVLNSFVQDFMIRSVIEFGCGDGNQLSVANYPSYIGLDVSETAIKLCRERFRNDRTKSFFLYSPDCFVDMHSIFKAELALSLDVIYHLIEDRIFELHLNHLFSAAERFVIIYSSDTDTNNPYQAPHVKHRHFSLWVKAHFQGWNLLQRIPNKYGLKNRKEPASCADFYIYARS